MYQNRVLYIALMVLMVLPDLRRIFSDKSDGIANVMTNTMNRLEKCLHGCHCQNLTGGMRNDSHRILILGGTLGFLIAAVLSMEDRDR